MRENGHRLIVTSLRDSMAYCACGTWFYSATTTSRDRDEALRWRIDREYQVHLRHPNRAAKIRENFSSEQSSPIG